jgi:hypothetical protein
VKNNGDTYRINNQVAGLCLQVVLDKYSNLLMHFENNEVSSTLLKLLFGRFLVYRTLL